MLASLASGARSARGAPGLDSVRGYSPVGVILWLGEAGGGDSPSQGCMRLCCTLIQYCTLIQCCKLIQCCTRIQHNRTRVYGCATRLQHQAHPHKLARAQRTRATRHPFRPYTDRCGVGALRVARACGSYRPTHAPVQIAHQWPESQTLHGSARVCTGRKWLIYNTLHGSARVCTGLVLTSY